MASQIEQVSVSFRYQPLPHQVPLWQAWHKGFRRFCLVWHRRSGKDLSAFALMMFAALQKVGSYYYVLPTFSQAKRILWDGSDNSGIRYVDYIPKELIKSKNETELQIELINPHNPDANGSIIQLMGADRMDYVVGTNPLGIVLSEYSLMRPSVWSLFDPILAANGGWALFAYTPRGQNHGYSLYQGALEVPDKWFVSTYNIEQTVRHDGKPIVSLDYIDQKRREGSPEEILQQEYWVSFNGAQVGNYYGKQFENLNSQGRVGSWPWDPGLPVDTAWDIGVGDSTAIWFFQEIGDHVRIVDYLEADGKGLDFFAGELYKKPYVLRKHYGPWDLEVREWGGKARSRVEQALDYGIRFTVTPKTPIEDGIQSVRALLPRCYFNQATTRDGVRALSEYHREYDEKRDCFKDKPDHDWTSHGADAFRVLAQNVRSISSRHRGRRAYNPVTGEVVGTTYIHEFDPHEVM